MTEFDEAKFEEKYAYYFEELERAYTDAYNHLHGRCDSEILKAIDRRVMDESEPVYVADGEFRVELPEDPYERAGDPSLDEEAFEAVLSEYTDRIETELRRIFEFEDAE